MKKLVILFLSINLIGCATFSPCTEKKTKPIIIQIEPEHILPGSIVKVKIFTPVNTKSVKGKLDIPGCPLINFKKKLQGEQWEFTTQIPLGLVWEKEKYKAIIEIIDSKGKKIEIEKWLGN